MAAATTRGSKSREDAHSVQFSHLLESNIPPTEEQSRRIRTLIHAMHAEIEVLLRRKTQGERGVWPWRKANLSRRIRKLTDRIRSYTPLLSIVRVLPAEIIQHIFLLSETNPWILSRICRDWRQCALSFPPLWANLPAVRINPKSRKRSAATLRRCTEMLRYSSNAPLTLRVFTVSPRITDDPALDLLVSHSYRWRTVKIGLSPVAVANLAPRIKGRLPILQTLFLRFSWIRDQSAVSVIDTFSDTPELKSLCVEGYFSGRVQFTAPNLTHLTCNWPPPFGLPALSQFTKLESLILTFGISLVETVFIPGNLMTFPHLKKIIADLTQDHDFSLIQSIIIPSITEILLQLPAGNGIDHITAMLIRSDQEISPGIRRFQLRHKAVLEPGQAITLLRLMPDLQSLEISMPHFNDVDEFARIDDSAHILVPKLETCTFFFEGVPAAARPSDELRSAIRTVVLNRCETPRNLNVTWQTDDVLPLRVFELGGPSCASVLPDGPIASVRDMTYLPLFTQADFENWTPTHRIQELADLHERLIEQLPHLYTGMLSFGTRPNGWVARVNVILDEIEALEALDPFDVLISNLHIAIEKLTAKRTKRFRKIVRWGLSFPQADRILSKWKALIASHLDEAHWVYTDLGYGSLESFMVYVKNDHTGRASEHMKDAVIGNDDGSVFGTKQSYLSSMTLNFRHHID